MRNRVPVLGVMIDAVSMNEAVRLTETFINGEKACMIATANAEMVMLAQADPELAGILAKADLVIPDGAGVVWAARHQRYQMPGRVAGCDLVQQLLHVSAQQNYRIYFLGGAPGIAEQAKRQAEKQYPGIKVVGIRDGFFSPEDEPGIIADIKSCTPHILLAALGVPKQEKWLARNLQQLAVPVAIGVGGTFDVMAGTVLRAPAWMQKAGLEWLYRLLRQPQRVLRMMALPRFVLKVVISPKKD